MTDGNHMATADVELGYGVTEQDTQQVLERLREDRAPWHRLMPSEGLWYLARARDGGFIAVTSARVLALGSFGSTDWTWSHRVEKVKSSRIDRNTLVLWGGTTEDRRDKVKLRFLDSDRDQPGVLEALERSRRAGNSQVVSGEQRLAIDEYLRSMHLLPSDEPLTPRARRAIEEGFPEQHAQMVEPILAHLAEAVEAAARGDVAGEEAAIGRGRVQAFRADSSSFMSHSSKAGNWYHARVSELERRGELRRGEFLGDAGSLSAWSDRVILMGDVYVLDGRVQAAVEVNGQILQSSRPTLTRMAAGAVLPGSALLVGLALPKTQTTDTRSAVISIVHPEWQIIEEIDPDEANEIAGIAARINAIAESHQRSEAMALAAAVQAPAAAPAAGPALPDALAKLASLRDAGALTEDEFATAKARLLA